MDSQWLKTQFALNPDKTKVALAEALGLEPPAISKILKGSRQIKAAEYVAMRRFFGLPADGDHALQPSKNIYRLHPLGEGGLRETRQGGTDWVLPADILNARTNAKPDQIKIFQVRESVMEPDFRQGEYVLVDLSDTTPSPPGFFIISDGFGFMVRKCAFVPKSQPPKITVGANVKNFEPPGENEFTITGRVIAKLQMV